MWSLDTDIEWLQFSVWVALVLILGLILGQWHLGVRIDGVTRRANDLWSLFNRLDDKVSSIDRELDLSEEIFGGALAELEIFGGALAELEKIVDQNARQGNSNNQQTVSSIQNILRGIDGLDGKFQAAINVLTERIENLEGDGKPRPIVIEVRGVDRSRVGPDETKASRPSDELRMKLMEGVAVETEHLRDLARIIENGGDALERAIDEGAFDTILGDINATDVPVRD